MIRQRELRSALNPDGPLGGQYVDFPSGTLYKSNHTADADHPLISEGITKLPENFFLESKTDAIWYFVSLLDGA